MNYPENIERAKKLVEETREKRLSPKIMRLNVDEAEAILKKYHPDFRKDAMRPVKTGSNKGDMMIREVADLLESHSLIDQSIDLSRVDFSVDVLVIGGGGAGCVAALWANDSGIKPDDILIAQKLRIGDSNSIMATGEMQMAIDPDDSPALHFLDTMGGGHFYNKPELVKVLVYEAPLVVRWREELGVMGSKKYPDGNFMLTKTGGCSRNRVTVSADYTGKEIMRVLVDEIENRGIKIIEFAPAIELLKDEYGNVAGAILLDMETKTYYIVKAKSTVITTGGFGRLHMQGFPTTNHYGATADGLVIAYRAGAKLRNMDSCQYHPTGSIYPRQIYGRLVTEKFRSMGAQPVNKNGELFVHPLEPRDIEASMIIRECSTDRDNGVLTPSGLKGVWIDIPILELIHGKGFVQNQFGAEYRALKRFDIDITKEPVLVYPTIHFQNGGIDINDKTETTIPGLFAAGEAAGGIHGKNRLGGNGVTAFMVFGRRAGINAAEHAKKAKTGKLTLEHVLKYEKSLETVPLSERAPRLLPEYRNEDTLSRYINVS